MTTTPITFRDVEPADKMADPITQMDKFLASQYASAYNHAINDALSVLEKHKKIYEGVEDLIAQLKDLKK